nr:phosphoribosylglycinamide formyltransferase [Feifania hominis]
MVSGGGTNLQALIDAERRGEIRGGELALVVSSSAGAYALERAAQAGIEAVTLPRREYAARGDYDRALIALLQSRGIGLVVLAGFLCVLGPEMVAAYRNRILNIHPSLIPAFCGDGFYGLRVHERALAAGVKVTGATVHFVSEITDGGPIVLQQAVAVREDDTAESLQQRVMREAEWKLLPRAVSLFCEGRIAVDGNRTTILQGGNEP